LIVLALLVSDRAANSQTAKDEDAFRIGASGKTNLPLVDAGIK
jgi:hypothetical protein